jgi:hypothetical protein
MASLPAWAPGTANGDEPSPVAIPHAAQMVCTELTVELV